MHRDYFNGWHFPKHVPYFCRWWKISDWHVMSPGFHVKDSALDIGFHGTGTVGEPNIGVPGVERFHKKMQCGSWWDVVMLIKSGSFLDLMWFCLRCFGFSVAYVASYFFFKRQMAFWHSERISWCSAWRSELPLDEIAKQIQDGDWKTASNVTPSTQIMFGCFQK